jgi:hypothetical protein
MSQIRIEGGVVVRSIVTNSEGTRFLHEEVGKPQLFVILTNENKTETTMWSGGSCSTALQVAEGLRQHERISCLGHDSTTEAANDRD